MGKLKVIIKEPNKEAYTKEIENTLEAQQEIVGGYIEVVQFGFNHLLILDEEGKLKGRQENIDWQDEFIVGTIILVRHEGEDFGSIQEEEEKWMIQMLNKAAI